MTSKLLPDATGTALLVDGPSPPADETIPRKPSAALVAATLASRLGDADGRVVLLSTSEAKADDIARTLAAMVGDTREVLVLPPWDCLPYDHASPSRESQGRRLMVRPRNRPSLHPPRTSASPHGRRSPSAPARLPDDYIPDATMRINLYARLASASAATAVDDLEDEIADRFGPLPDEVANLVGATRLAALGAEAGVSRIARGPKATAFSIAPDWLDGVRARLPDAGGGRWTADRLIFDTGNDQAHDDAFLSDVLSRLAA